MTIFQEEEKSQLFGASIAKSSRLPRDHAHTNFPPLEELSTSEVESFFTNLDKASTWADKTRIAVAADHNYARDSDDFELVQLLEFSLDNEQKKNQAELILIQEHTPTQELLPEPIENCSSGENSDQVEIVLTYTLEILGSIERFDETKLPKLEEILLTMDRGSLTIQEIYSPGQVKSDEDGNEEGACHSTFKQDCGSPMDVN